jgi:hypothetical protein
LENIIQRDIQHIPEEDGPARRWKTSGKGERMVMKLKGKNVARKEGLQTSHPLTQITQKQCSKKFLELQNT